MLDEERIYTMHNFTLSHGRPKALVNLNPDNYQKQPQIEYPEHGSKKKKKKKAIVCASNLWKYFSSTKKVPQSPFVPVEVLIETPLSVISRPKAHQS